MTTTKTSTVAARHRVKELVETPKSVVGGIEMLSLDRAATADLVIRLAKARGGGDEPITISSANGEVISRCATDARIADLHRDMDIINADGQSLIFASRLFCDRPLPERVATTDFFHDVVQAGLASGVTHYMLGANPEENLKAQARVRSLYPDIKLLGGTHGYLSAAELDAKVAEINALKPDVLWVALGVPGQQEFCRKYGKSLANVGVIQTCGGLFNFLSGTRKRAPGWLQRAGLEWVYRIKEEPRRLFWRYAVTNPHAIYLLARYSA
jgi:N-acetylglucosaminyldiphosphoundecaprenol N-acetyl-beta-D-mannosaminyltransferase